MELLVGLPLLAAVVIGVVELVKRAVNLEWKACAIILSAAVAGYLLSSEVGADITRIQGLFVGFAASGLVTFAQNFGGKPSSPELG
jgi:hypothetical protein